MYGNSLVFVSRNSVVDECEKVSATDLMSIYEHNKTIKGMVEYMCDRARSLYNEMGADSVTDSFAIIGGTQPEKLKEFHVITNILRSAGIEVTIEKRYTMENIEKEKYTKPVHENKKAPG